MSLRQRNSEPIPSFAALTSKTIVLLLPVIRGYYIHIVNKKPYKVK